MYKKLLIALLIGLIVSCSSEEDSDFSAYDTANGSAEGYDEFLPITNVLIPEVIYKDKPVDIFLYYTVPTFCHTFKDIFYSAKNNERTVAILSTVIQKDSCNTKTDSVKTDKTSFKFNAEEFGDYKLKFWKGKDEKGTDVYSIYNIKVEN